MKIIWDFDELFDFGERISDVDEYNRTMESATKELTNALLKALKTKTPVVTGTLRSGWGNGSYTIQRVKSGYEVTLYNKTPYASWVNYGHRVRNKPNGQYLKVHNRVKVPVAHKLQNPKNEWYVFGHFFLEDSILEVEQKTKQIIEKELQKWFRWCCYG